jgi:hypothetical protein
MTGPTEKRWRLPLRFGLRLALAAVLIVAIGFAVVAHYARRAAAQRAVVVELERVGGMVSYAHVADEYGNPIDPSWFRRLVGNDFLGKVDGLWFPRKGTKDTVLRDEDFERIAQLPDLRFLSLNRTTTNDHHLSLLVGLQDLESLVLRDTQITDDGLRHLHELPRLRWLILDGTKVNPSAVHEFQKANPAVRVVY